MRRPINDSNLAIKTTVSSMIELFNQTSEQLRRSYATLNTTEKLVAMHIGRFTFSDRYDRTIHFDEVEEVIENMRVNFWRVIIDKLEVRAILSVQRAKELDDLLQRKSKDLPPLTEEEVFKFAASYHAALPAMHLEAVTEVFEFLRPPQSKLKTNTEFELREKVILHWLSSNAYSGTYSVNEYCRSRVKALEQIFRVFDGKGRRREYASELEMKIEQTHKDGDGTGATEYFKFRCHKNGNLHLQFLRMDLVDKLNKIAGGKRLRAA